MRVNLQRLVGKTYAKQDDEIEQIKKEAAHDPCFISDLLVDHQTAGNLLTALREDKRELYYLKVIRDEWGNDPHPGDKVRRKFKRSLKTKGPEPVPIPVQTLNTWKRAGVYDERRYYYTDYEVDKKGCIKVNAADAEYFLSNWGVHSDSGMPISYHPIPHSEDPAPCPAGGKLYVWYYRFEEVDASKYAQLEPISGKGPKFGIDRPGLMAKDIKSIVLGDSTFEDWKAEQMAQSKEGKRGA